MGLIRLTLITLVLLWLGMKHFGRDEGLSGHLIGREAEPPAVTVVEDIQPEPEAPAPGDTTAPAPVADPEPIPAPQTDFASTSMPDNGGAQGSFDASAGILDEINAAEQAEEAAAESPPLVEVEVPETDDPQVVEPEQTPDVADDSAMDDFYPTPEPAPLDQLQVTGSKVNVRAGPSTQNEVIDALTEGTIVSDLGDAGDGWRQILLPSGEIGFMSGDFLTLFNP